MNYYIHVSKNRATVTEDILDDLYQPLDLNGAYVPFRLSQKDKESPHNLEMAHKANLVRFGLTEDGI